MLNSVELCTTRTHNSMHSAIDCESPLFIGVSCDECISHASTIPIRPIPIEVAWYHVTNIMADARVCPSAMAAMAGMAGFQSRISYARACVGTWFVETCHSCHPCHERLKRPVNASRVLAGEGGDSRRRWPEHERNRPVNASAHRARVFGRPTRLRGS